jgi:hypothetical protein
MPTTAIPQTVTYNPGSISRSDSRKTALVGEAYIHNSAGSITTTASKTDRVELSERGRLLSQATAFAKGLADLPDIRPDEIEKARQALDSGKLSSREAIRHAARNLRKLLQQHGE